MMRISLTRAGMIDKLMRELLIPIWRSMPPWKRNTTNWQLLRDAIQQSAKQSTLQEFYDDLITRINTRIDNASTVISSFSEQDIALNLLRNNTLTLMALLAYEIMDHGEQWEEEDKT